jgi:hypothetical protein
MNYKKHWSIFAGLALIVLVLSLIAMPAQQTQAAGPSLVIIPAQAAQGPDQEVVLHVTGFMPNESTTIWQTYPNYTVMPIGNFAVDNTGILRLPIAIDGSVPVGLHHFSVRGNMSGSMVITPFEVLPPAVNLSEGVGIDVTCSMGGKQGSNFTFNGYGYQYKEDISIWLTLPDGTVESIGNKRSHNGEWAKSVSFDETDQTGHYFVTGYGVVSGRTGVAEFIVTGGNNMMDTVGTATLIASPSNTRQLETVQLMGSGFAPGEVISIWITMADGTVWDSRKMIATDGTFTLAGLLPAEIPQNGFPIGETTFTAYGNSSKLIATATIQLWAGDGM